MESFPILAEETRRWFALASFEVKGNWDDLMKKFCEWFFSLSKVQYNHTGYIFGKESAGDIIRKLFEEKEEEIDLDEVLEIKRTLGVNSESSPYAHIAKYMRLEAIKVKVIHHPHLVLIA